ncbi:hypothetical protein N7342_04500 [Chromobacterium haemolyticum]|nr:hypothetical protein [Chromobacterium haemolyticum]MDH0340769.1 hypothetical protein [Chromobacterium haemolyticum]QOD84045.1 hypothetical protein IEZ30_06085 [Chromobacterium haemolyticum]
MSAMDETRIEFGGGKVLLLIVAGLAFVVIGYFMWTEPDPEDSLILRYGAGGGDDFLWLLLPVWTASMHAGQARPDFQRAGFVGSLQPDRSRLDSLVGHCRLGGFGGARPAVFDRQGEGSGGVSEQAGAGGAAIQPL